MNHLSRVVAAVTVALALAAAAPAPASDRPPGATVLLIGDSNVFGHFGRSLEARLVQRGHRVFRRGKPTSGLARPDFFDWFAAGRELVERHDPDVVIALFGGNDGQRLSFRDRGLRSVRWKDEARWRGLYHERVSRLAELLRGERRTLILLSPTNRRPPDLRARMSRVRDVQRGAVAGMARVRWVDMFEHSSDARGRWLRAGRDAEGRAVTYRRRDGVHLTPEGGAEVARRVMVSLLAHGL